MIVIIIVVIDYAFYNIHHFVWKVCAGVEEEGENQEVYVKTLANQTCSGELFLLDDHIMSVSSYQSCFNNHDDIILIIIYMTTICQ